MRADRETPLTLLSAIGAPRGCAPGLLAIKCVPCRSSCGKSQLRISNPVDVRHAALESRARQPKRPMA